MGVGLLISALLVVQARSGQRTVNQEAAKASVAPAAQGCGAAQVRVLPAARSDADFSIRMAVPPVNAPAKVTGAAACDRAVREVGGGQAQSVLVELSLYSDDVFGGTDGKNPKYQNVLAWVVTFQDTPCPSAAPEGEFGPGTMVVAVDATSGEFLNAHYRCPPG
jgi:hypothetical protein